MLLVKDNLLREFPVVQWLGLGAFTAGTWVWSLIEELKSRKQQSVAKNKQTKKTTYLNNGASGYELMLRVGKHITKYL